MTNNLLLDTLNGHNKDHTPIWMMRQAGRYLPEYRNIRASQKDFISFCLNPKEASTITLQPITRYGFDVAIIFSDILMVPGFRTQRQICINVGPIPTRQTFPHHLTKH